MPLNEAQELVTRFHEHIGATVSNSPQLLPCSRTAARWLAVQVHNLAQIAAQGAEGTKDLLLSRTALSLEELAEWLLAHADSDLDAAADAIADRAYVVVGDAVAAGLPLADLFDAIHTSNMSKLPGVTTASIEVGCSNCLPQY